MAQEKKTRQANIELLRIIAMLMIITLHYLDKGRILAEFNLNATPVQMGYRQIQIFCIVAVNIYVLISGYFLVEAKFTFKKLVMLWAQVIFYAWGIAAIFIATGGIDLKTQGIYDLIPVILPMTGNHYWFATIYAGLFLVSPFLNVMIRNMSRSQHKIAVIVMVSIFCLWNTFLPFTIPVSDREGMDLPWFVCLYLIAAYIRKYPDCIRLRRGWYIAIYFVMAFSSLFLGILLLKVDSFVGKLGGYASNFFPYNSLFTLVGSVAVFLFFLKCNIKDGKISKAIVKLGACTFSVFLIHEHFYMRYLWPKWLRVPEMAGKPYLIVHLIGTVLTVFIVCAIIDFIRQWIFKRFFASKAINGIFKKCEKLEMRINGGKE